MKPFNRHILVEPIEEKQEETESVIVLPTDYEKPKSQYILGKVLELSDDCKIKIDIGDMIVIERRMLHAIEISSETYYLVLENYIFGRTD